MWGGMATRNRLTLPVVVGLGLEGAPPREAADTLDDLVTVFFAIVLFVTATLAEPVLLAALLLRLGNNLGITSQYNFVFFDGR